MAEKKERGLWEFYASDPEKADAEIWGRKPNPVSRRGFLKKTGLATMTLAIGSQIPFFRNIFLNFFNDYRLEVDVCILFLEIYSSKNARKIMANIPTNTARITLSIFLGLTGNLLLYGFCIIRIF